LLRYPKTLFFKGGSMKLKTRRAALDGRDGKVEIKRNRFGIPKISAILTVEHR
jgi:hypothetical protein